MNYLVMECHPGYAVVLSGDGRFLKVANMRYEVGQTVTEVVEMSLPQAQPEKRHNRRWISALSAMAACLVLVVTSIFFAGQMPYASVYMTINPEVRIDVNRNDVVVGVEGVNADGADLLEGYEYKNKDLDLVMDELVDRAIDMGYLSDGGTVTLTLDADDEWVVSHSDSLSTHLNGHLTEKISVTIEVTSKQARETQPGQEIVIPIEPDHGGTGYGTEPPTQAVSDTDYTDTDYGAGSDGVTDYGTPDDGDDVTDNSGDSGYDENTTDDGDSGYESDDDDSDDDTED